MLIMTQRTIQTKLPLSLKNKLLVKYETRLPVTKSGNKPDIICFTYGTYGSKLGLKVINHHDIKSYFIDLLVKHYDNIIRLVNYLNNYSSSNVLTLKLTQETMTDWQLWLIKHFNHKWDQSPYSLSFYNSSDISWNHKPENSLRLSDHWNFVTFGETHCKTDDPSLKHGWALGKYHNGQYQIIKRFTNQHMIEIQ